MPVDVQWGNADQSVLLCRCIQDWHWTDYRLALHESTRLLGGVDHPVHMIIDLRRAGRIPVGAFNHLQLALNKLPPNLGLIVFVGADDIATTIGKVLKRQYPRPFDTVQSVATIEDAYSTIKQHQSAEST